MTTKTTTTKKTREVALDAAGRTIGRVASEAASILLGKDKADFQRNTVADVRVSISNASKLSISENRMKNSTFKRYSGYPGGLTEEPMEKLISRKGTSEVLRLAIYGMLPGNKLRPQIMKNLIITE